MVGFHRSNYTNEVLKKTFNGENATLGLIDILSFKWENEKKKNILLA